MFQNLKSLFVTVEETEENKVEVSENSREKPVTNSPAGKSQEIVPEKAATGLDYAIIDKLLKALEDNNQPEFDYFEYKTSLKSLEKFPMDEATKYQSAFATAATMNVTLEKLLNSIEFYKKVLNVEEEKFLKASKEQFALNVDNKIKEKDKLEAQIKEKSSKIQQLTEEIREHQKQQEELSMYIASSDKKIKLTESNFHMALQSLVAQINEDANKLKQYIK